MHKYIRNKYTGGNLYLLNMVEKDVEIRYSYRPSESVVNHLSQVFNFEKVRYEKKAVGERLSRGEENRVYKNKHTLLNILFRSTANLVYFLEFIKKHNIVARTFEEELKELLGIMNRNVNVQEGKEDRLKHPFFRSSFVFGRLVSALLDLNLILYESVENKGTLLRNITNESGKARKRNPKIFPSSYRLLLIESLQRNISSIITQLALIEFEDNDGMRELIMNDMARATSWVTYFAKEAFYRLEPKLDELDSGAYSVHRPVNF